ncbi:MAG TPA: GNAT family N-acetyltransferase [Pyrinomonadaceae bacterium]|nr:GNAT family N-acetyltransferase [Pyrinomonadaceae bacterium]
MVEEIRQADTITDEEKEWLYNWSEDVFGVTSLDLRFRPKDVHFFMDVGGVPLSHVSLLRHEIGVDGQRLTVAGLGGVVTRPEAQGKGYAGRLIRHAAEFFEREWDVDAGMLFCLPRLTPYYESLGWQVIAGPVFIEQPTGRMESPFPALILPCRVRAWPEGAVELGSLPW